MNYLLEPRPPEALAWTPSPASDPGSTPAANVESQAQPRPVAPTPVTTPIELQTAFFNYRMLQPGIGYMQFFTLLDDSISGTERRFRRAVGEMFRRIESDQPHTLIIDIRENGGGDDTLAGELFRHMTEKPFRLLASTQIKRSQEVRALGKSVLRIPFRWMGLPYLHPEGRKYYRGAVGSLSPPEERPIRALPRAEPFFAGPVCVLTGPRTFSAAVSVADPVKAFGLATIVGEDTGGQPNSFGNPAVFPLPHSRFPVQIATASSVRASGDATDFSPVIPDILVRPTPADLRAGFDPVLERAKNCPPRSVR